MAKGIGCSVLGCDKKAVRSLSSERVGVTGLKVGGVTRAYLCKDHYKEFKKETRKQKMLERWRYKSRGVQ